MPRTVKTAGDVREAIWARAVDLAYVRAGKVSVPVRKIIGELARDECGLGRKVEISERTAHKQLADLRKERGEPKVRLVAGDEVEAARSIGRRAIELAAREIERLEWRQSRHGLELKEARTLRELHRMVADAEQRESKRRELSRSSSAAYKGSAAAASAPRSSLADQLRQAGDRAPDNGA
jgi:hypothetical protein